MALVANRWTLKPRARAADRGHRVRHLLHERTTASTSTRRCCATCCAPTSARRANCWRLALVPLPAAVRRAAAAAAVARAAGQPVAAGAPRWCAWARCCWRLLAAVRRAAGGVPAVRLADAQPQGNALPDHAGQRAVVARRGAGQPSARRGRAAQADRPRRRPAPAGRRASKPLLLVLVVGETARAANWGSTATRGRPRRELAALPVINFTDVTSCGTNTEVSLPCMFAPVGRRDYDEAAHPRQRVAAARAGARRRGRAVARQPVGLQGRVRRPAATTASHGLERARPVQRRPLPRRRRCCTASTDGCASGAGHAAAGAAPAGQPRAGVLPALPARPSRASRRPATTTTCSTARREQIVNAYDNALLYTDHVLAELIAQLQCARRQRRHGAALRVRPRRVARREPPVPARRAVRDRAATCRPRCRW